MKRKKKSGVGGLCGRAADAGRVGAARVYDFCRGLRERELRGAAATERVSLCEVYVLRS